VAANFFTIPLPAKPSESAGSQIVAIGKAPGNDQRIEGIQISVTMPDKVYGLAHML